MNLTQEVIEKRWDDINNDEKKWGWKGRVAKKWGFDHGQNVTKFMKKHNQ